MALSTQKESFPVVIPFPREYILAPMGFDTSWSEIRVGVFIAGLDANSENFSNGLIEQITIASASDYITFGIKDSATTALPGEAGSTFIGIRGLGTISMFSNYNIGLARTTGVVGDDLRKMKAVGYSGATLVDGGEIISGSFSDGGIYFPDVTLTQGYCGFYAIKIRIIGRGLATQSISMSLAAKSPVDGFDYSPTALGELINNSIYGSEVTIPWNSGGAARDIPDSFFMRIPFYRNRFMLASIKAINYLT